MIIEGVYSMTENNFRRLGTIGIVILLLIPAANRFLNGFGLGETFPLLANLLQSILCVLGLLAVVLLVYAFNRRSKLF